MPHGDMDAGPGYTLALAACFACGETFGFNPHTVISVPIDPETNRPPDVGPEGQNVTPDPAALARAVRMPLCHGCVRRVYVPEEEKK